MIDITLCTGEGCKLRESCHRYVKGTIKNYSQKNKKFVSYFSLIPYKKETKQCEFYYGSNGTITNGESAFFSLLDIFSGKLNGRRRKKRRRTD